MQKRTAKTKKQPKNQSAKKLQTKQTTKKPPNKAEKKSVSADKIGFHAVKLVKIKNKYMFTPKEKNEQDYNPEGVHTYIVFKYNDGRIGAIRTTHLYEKKKENQLNKKILMEMKLPGIRFRSGIRRGVITTDIEGEELDLNKVRAVNIKGNRGTYLSKKQAEKVFEFADRKGIKKKKP